MEKFSVDRNLDGDILFWDGSGTPVDLAPGEEYYSAAEVDSALAAKDRELAERQARIDALQDACFKALSFFMGGQSSYADAKGFLVSVLAGNEPPDTEPNPDSARLDFVDSECADVRCHVHRGPDDSDTYYQMVTFHMNEPRERAIGEGRSTRAAIDDAMAGKARAIEVLQRSEGAASMPEPPYLIRSFWSPDRRHLITVHAPLGGEILISDDNGNVWDAAGEQEDIAQQSQVGDIKHPDSARLDKLPALRDLVDRVWNEATESEQVPSTDWADRIIKAWIDAHQEPKTCACRSTHSGGSMERFSGTAQPSACQMDGPCIRPKKSTPNSSSRSSQRHEPKVQQPNTRRRSIKKRLQSLLIELAETEGMYPSGSIGRRDVGQALERLRQAIVWTGENI